MLEIAAGTGVATRRLVSVLPENNAIVATDLNQPMLDIAAAIGTQRPMEWRQADAMKLPFRDEMFDAVFCQFGAMFFPEKAKAFFQAHRVLKAGGVFIFSVWDRIEENEFADVITTALASVLPNDPPRFLARTPHGYYDHPAIERDPVHGGFTASPQISTVAARSRPPLSGPPRSHTARVHPCETRSRRATPRYWAKPPTSPRKLSPSASGGRRSTARFRPKLSPSKTEVQL